MQPPQFRLCGQGAACGGAMRQETYGAGDQWKELLRCVENP